MDPTSAASTLKCQVATCEMAVHNRQTHATLPLPAEVRLMVYERVFSKSYVVIWVRGVPAKNLSILRVSSATKKEALEVLYSKSMFLFVVSEYHSVSSQTYNAKTSGLRNAGIKLFPYRSRQRKYQRVNAITDRLIRALTSNCQLERFDILTTHMYVSDAWRQLANLKTLKLLGRCREITFHAETWCMYSVDSDDEDQVGCMGQTDIRAYWNVLRKKLEEASGNDVEIKMKGEVKIDCRPGGVHNFKATVQPNGASA